MAKTISGDAACIDFVALKEDQIYMADFIKNYDQVEEERRKFENCIRHHNDLQILNNDPKIVNMRAILDLFEKLPAGPCGARIRGLRVIFGLENDTVIFFFSPVAMTRVVSEPAIPSDVTYDIDQHAPVYWYKDGNFDDVNQEYYAACRKNYFDNIWVQRYKNSDFYTLQDNGDWDSDTQEVIFSFQEIFYLYHKAHPCREGSAYDKDLYFYNGVANYRRTLLNRWRRKHTIFITAESLEKTTHDHDINAISAVNQAANLAHLCPPNCSPVYRITATFPCP